MKTVDEATEDLSFEDDYKYPSDTESCLGDFFNNSLLSDVSLINPSTGALMKIHRAIVASGSRYFLRVFSRASRADPEFVPLCVEVPLPMKTSQDP